MSTIIKLSQDVTQHYKNITSPICTNERIQEIYNYEQYERCSRVIKGKLESLTGVPGRKGLWMANSWSTTLLLRNSDHQEVHQGSSSKIWTCRSKGVRNSPASGVMNAKWRAGTSTRVSINSNQKHVLKTVSWVYTPEHEWGIK